MNTTDAIRILVDAGYEVRFDDGAWYVTINGIPEMRVTRKELEQLATDLEFIELVG